MDNQQTDTVPVPPQFSIPTVEEPTHHMSRRVAIYLPLAILVLLGGFFSYQFLFAQKPVLQEHFFASTFSAIDNIKSARYKVDLNIFSENRDTDAQPFKPVDDNGLLARYEADKLIVIDAQKLIDSLEIYNALNSDKYPRSLSDLDLGFTPSHFVYTLLTGNRGYQLNFTLQTDEAVSALQKIKNTQIAVAGKSIVVSGNGVNRPYLYIPSRISSSGIMDIYGTADEVFNYVDPSLGVKVFLAGIFDKITHEQQDFEVNTGAEVSMQGFSMKLAAESRLKDGALYFQISEFPSLISSYLGGSFPVGDWIKVDLKDKSALSMSGLNGVVKSLDSVSSGQSDAKEKAYKYMTSVLLAADATGFFEYVADPISENLNDVGVYKYVLRIKPENAKSFYKKLVSELDKSVEEDKPITVNQEVIDSLDDPSFQNTLQYIANNVTFSVWSDKGMRTPYKIQVDMRLVPDETKSPKWKGKQMKLQWSLELTSVNENISVEQPTEFKTLKQYVMEVKNWTESDYLQAEQTNNIRQLRSSLGVFKSAFGIAPYQLSDLTKTGAELKQHGYVSVTDSDGKSLSYYSSYYDNRPFIVDLPSDAYGGSYKYAQTTDGYTLTYAMKLSPYKAGDALPSIISHSWSSKASIYAMTVIDGLNTTTSGNSLSLEADQANKLDSDGDGVSDAVEKYLGTNPNKKDSDGDGYNDGEELSRGLNPLGTGYLKATTYYSGGFPFPSL